MSIRCLSVLLMIIVAPTTVPGARGSDVVVRPHREADAKGPLPVLRSGKWGYIDHSGTVVIAPQFDDAGFFYESRAAVRLGNRWGYVDIAGGVVIQPTFTSASRFSDGLAHVRLTDSSSGEIASAYIDTAGQVVVTCGPGNPDIRLTAARCGRPFSNGFVAEAIEVFRCVDEAGNPVAKDYPCAAVLIDRWGYYNKLGRLAIPGPFHSGLTRFSDGLAAVQPYGESVMGFIDASGAFVGPPQYERAAAFSEGLAAVRMGTLWGFIDRQGHRVIEARFQSVSDFSEGYAAVRLDGLWGYIDRTGRFLIRPRFQEAASFSQGLAAVCCDDGKARYVDAAGRWAFSAVFPRGISNAGVFIEGVALVEINAIGAAYIDRQGSVIAPMRSRG